VPALVSNSASVALSPNLLNLLGKVAPTVASSVVAPNPKQITDYLHKVVKRTVLSTVVTSLVPEPPIITLVDTKITNTNNNYTNKNSYQGRFRSASRQNNCNQSDYFQSNNCSISDNVQHVHPDSYTNCRK